MNITIDKESSRLYIAAEEVARFARTKKSAPLRIPFCEREGEYSDDADIRRELSFAYTKGNYPSQLQAFAILSGRRADGGLLKRSRKRQK